MGKVTVVVGGFAGSEAKGAVCGRLAQEREYTASVRVGGPNAGHTVYDEQGQKFALRQIPVAAVTDPGCQLMIAAGSEVDLNVLYSEIETLERAGHMVRDRLYVDREATLVEPQHADAERSIQTGTTGKGIGAARAARMLRKARRVEDFTGGKLGFMVADTQPMLREPGTKVLLEGTQGYILGSHAGYYPYCTSGDCRAIDMMAMAGLPPQEVETWVVLRMHPIRIAGDSGPLPNETTWAELGVPPEITTVTKKTRRVGQWNYDWARQAIEANGGDVKLALMFTDYVWPELKGCDGGYSVADYPDAVEAGLEAIEAELGVEINMLGTGPASQLLIGDNWNG